MAKYDWIKLEREFTTHKKYATMSLREFAKSKGIPYGANFQKATKDWLDKRVAKQWQKSGKIAEQIEAKQVATEVDRNTKILSVVDKFLGAMETVDDGVVKLLMLNGKNMAAWLKGLETLQKIHRVSEGLDKQVIEIKNSDHLKEILEELKK